MQIRGCAFFSICERNTSRHYRRPERGHWGANIIRAMYSPISCAVYKHASLNESVDMRTLGAFRYDLDGNGVVDRSELFSLLYNLPADLWLNTPYPIVGSALRRDRNPHSNVSLTDEEKKTLVRRVVNLVFDQVYPPHQSGPEAHPGSSATNIGESKGDTRVGNVEQELLCHLMPSAPLRAEDFETAESTSSYRQWSPRCLNADVDDGLSLTFEQFTRAAQAIPELLSVGKSQYGICLTRYTCRT